MFRLKEQQLHIILFLIAGVTLLLFCIFGIKSIPQLDEHGILKGMDDFSEGWVCTYETNDAEKLQSNKDNTSQSKNDNVVVEVISLPSDLKIVKNTTVTLMHKVPSMKQDTIYMTIETDNQDIEVSIGEDILYINRTSETMLPVRHVIPIEPKYREETITIKISPYSGEKVSLGTIESGTYNQLWASAFSDSAVSVGIGIVLICLGLIVSLIGRMSSNTWKQTRVLQYSGIEGTLLGILLFVDGDWLTVLTGWHSGVYILKACVILLALMMHLMIVRCFIYKKRVLSFVDAGLLGLAVFFISVIVLQFFSLIQYDTIYKIGIVLFGIGIISYTIVLAIMIVHYRRKEGKPAFIANILLVISMLIQLVVHLSGLKQSSGYVYIFFGILLYVIYMCVYGLKNTLQMQTKEDEAGRMEERIRGQVMERLNPNLLFAAFQTLQNLIKNGSANSVKMLYYISVYFHNNLKSLEERGSVISFEEELEHIIAYLQLQKTRNHNLEFSLECREKEFQVPRYSIEPIVENAVKHGIANQDNQGTVVLRTYMRADGYAIQVIDDGVGFDTEQLKKDSPTALRSLFDMLEEQCQAKTEVVSKEGKGTVVTIILPVLENDLMDKEDLTER